MVMKKAHTQWVILSLGLAVTVGCTVPLIVGTQKNSSTQTDGAIQPETNPSTVQNRLPVFLPQPGGNNTPIAIPSSGGFSPIASNNPTIEGPLPDATPTPFLPNIGPNTDNQISPSGLPLIGNPTDGGLGGITTPLPSQLPIVKSIIKGRVLGYDTETEKYKPLPGAKVRVGSSLALTTDANGFYETTQEFDELVTISAAFDNHVSSTVTDIPPGVNRDIHLSPLQDDQLYRQETFNLSGSVTNLAENGRESFVVFADGKNTFSPIVHPDKFTGRFSLNVRTKGTVGSTKGTLFTGVFEQVGKLQQLTQYGMSSSVQVPKAPPEPFPTPTPELAEGQQFPLDNTQLLLSLDNVSLPQAFGEINVNITAPAGSPLRGAVLHVYMNTPEGGRILVAKYNDNTNNTISTPIRVPRVSNATFTVEAHSGTALKGSDIVVPNVQVGNTVTRTFMSPPKFNRIGDETDFSNLNKTHFSTSDLTPTMSWEGHSEANSYQLDLQSDLPEHFRWEAYTLGTTITYPDYGSDHPASLELGKNYRVQLMASDFDLGTFNILSQGNWNMPQRLSKTLDMSGGFNTQLADPSVKNLSQGYRVSYSTISFLSN